MCCDISSTLVYVDIRWTTVPIGLTLSETLYILTGCGGSPGLCWPAWVNSIGYLSTYPTKR